MLWLLSAVIGNQAEMIRDDRISDATIEEKREFCVGTTSRMREGRAEQAGTHPGRTRRAGYQGCAKRSREARCGAKRRSRRASGGWEGGTHVCPWGMVERRVFGTRRGVILRGTRSSQIAMEEAAPKRRRVNKCDWTCTSGTQNLCLCSESTL